MLYQEQEYSRHPEEEGDILALEQLQGLCRVKGALYDHRAADVDHGQGEKPDAADVKHGQDQEVSVV